MLGGPSHDSRRPNARRWLGGAVCLILLSAGCFPSHYVMQTSHYRTARGLDADPDLAVPAWKAHCSPKYINPHLTRRVTDRDARRRAIRDVGLQPGADVVVLEPNDDADTAGTPLLVLGIALRVGGLGMTLGSMGHGAFGLDIDPKLLAGGLALGFVGMALSIAGIVQLTQRPAVERSGPPPTGFPSLDELHGRGCPRRTPDR